MVWLLNALGKSSWQVRVAAKKVILSILIFYLLTCIPFTVRASSLYLVKDVNNPLNTNFFVLQSAVKKVDGQYNMWFTGHNGTNLKIGYATSLDGVNWPASQFVSVNDTGDNHDPSIFEHDGSTYIYYISEPAEGSGINIQIKRSIVQASQFSSPETISVERQPWNSKKLSCPFGYFENGTYFLFYCGNDGGNWTIGLATSSDGTSFSPCSNNPIITGSNLGNPQLFVDQNGTRHLLYHSDNGIEEATSMGELTCQTQWSGRGILLSRNKIYDQNQIIAPSLIYNSNPKELFYTARGPQTGDNWRLNRAVENLNKPKIIIIPGFFASWSKDAILHNDTVSQNDWKIPSYVHEYDGIIKTLENLGYVKNVDYYVFPYDWRKPLSETADQLHEYLQTNIWNIESTDSVGLVGHSMGGLVGRIYAQKYTGDNVSQIVTVGSPHKGVVQVYQPLEAGETKRDDSFLWLGTKLLINLNRKNFNYDRQVVQSLIPSLYDLFPTFEFLKTKRGMLIPHSTLSIQNTLLQNYSDISSIDEKMTVLYGTKTNNNTPSGIVIGNRALIDHLVNDYKDGRPISYSYGSGDYLVPTISSQNGSLKTELSLDHGEMMYASEAVGQILNTLNIPHEDIQIQEGKATKLSPSLIIAIQSPIEVKMEVDGKVFSPENGILFIPNAQTGTYTLRVKKIRVGNYSVTIAQIAQKNDVWERFEGRITSDNLDEEDIFTIDFNNIKATPQIKIKKCSKYTKTSFNFRKRSDCVIKHHEKYD